MLFRSEPVLRAAGIEFAGAVFGFRKSGRMNLDEVRRASESARVQTTEIYFHPGAEAVLRDPAEVAALLAQHSSATSRDRQQSAG